MRSGVCILLGEGRGWGGLFALKRVRGPLILLFGVVKLALNVILSSADERLVEIDDSELSKLV